MEVWHPSEEPAKPLPWWATVLCSLAAAGAAWATITLALLVFEG